MANKVKNSTNLPFLKSGWIRLSSILVVTQTGMVSRDFVCEDSQPQLFRGQVTIFDHFCGFFFMLQTIRKTLSGDVRIHEIMGRIMDGQTAKLNGFK